MKEYIPYHISKKLGCIFQPCNKHYLPLYASWHKQFSHQAPYPMIPSPKYTWLVMSPIIASFLAQKKYTHYKHGTDMELMIEQINSYLCLCNIHIWAIISTCSEFCLKNVFAFPLMYACTNLLKIYHLNFIIKSWTRGNHTPFGFLLSISKAMRWAHYDKSELPFFHGWDSQI